MMEHIDLLLEIILWNTCSSYAVNIVTHIVSLLTEVAVVAVVVMVVGGASGFGSGPGLGGRGCLGLGNGGSTSSMWVRGNTGRNNADSLLCKSEVDFKYKYVIR